MDRVLLGMSGGVDSSVAAIMLMEQGYEVIGATMKLWDPEDENGQSKCCGDDSILDAKRVCDKLGIPLYSTPPYCYTGKAASAGSPPNT